MPHPQQQATDESAAGDLNDSLVTATNDSRGMATLRRREFIQGPLSPMKTIRKCIDLLENFNPVVTSIDCHAVEHLGPDCEGKDANPDKAFIKQVLYGCISNKKALTVFMTHFYGENAANILRADYLLYQVFAYLILFRLNDLGWDGLKQLALSQEPGKMWHILHYCFLGQSLQRGIKQDWLRVFDIACIDGTIWGTLQHYHQEAQSFCDILHAKAFGLAEQKEKEKKEVQGLGKVQKKALTVPNAPKLHPPTRWKLPMPKAPKLHPPSRRKVPMPKAISTNIIIGKEPAYLDWTPNVEEIESEKLRRRKDLMAEKKDRHEKGSRPFNFAETKCTINKAKKEMEEKRQASLDFDRKYCKPVPKLPSEGATVKLNTAAILREDALFKRKQEIECALLKAYEEDLRDSSEYYTWQQQAKAHDRQIQKTRVEERRAFAKQAALEAKAAMDKLKEDNHEYAKQIKCEGLLLSQQRQTEIQMNEEMNRQLVKEVQEVREKAPKVAKEKVFHRRRRLGQNLKVEKAQARQKQMEEEAVLAEERADRIRRLKADHEVIRKQVKVFDPTSTSGQGFLNEISLMEAKERIVMNRLREKEQEENRRVAILTEKQKKQNELLKRVHNIRRLRQAAKADAQHQRQVKAIAVKEAEDYEQRCRESKQVMLLEELEAAREVRLRELTQLAEEEKKVLAEQKHLHEQSEQSKAKITAQIQAMEDKDKEGTEAEFWARRQAKIDEIKTRNRAPKKKLKIHLMVPQEVEEEHDIARLKAENAESSLQEKTATLNRYAATITQRNVTQARRHQQVHSAPQQRVKWGDETKKLMNEGDQAGAWLATTQLVRNE